MAEQTFFVIFSLVAAWMLFKVIKNRGWKGAMFGAPTRKMTCEMKLGARDGVHTKLKLHTLDPHDRDQGPHVGVEVIHWTFGSWRMSPVSLTRAEARKLAEELSCAAKDSETESIGAG